MSEAPETTPVILTPEEKVFHVRQGMIQQFNAVYAQIVHMCDSIPFDNVFKQFAIMNLDQGKFWFETGIKAMNFTVEPPPSPDEGANPVEGFVDPSAHAEDEGKN